MPITNLNLAHIDEFQHFDWFWVLQRRNDAIIIFGDVQSVERRTAPKYIYYTTVSEFESEFHNTRIYVSTNVFSRYFWLLITLDTEIMFSKLN